MQGRFLWKGAFGGGLLLVLCCVGTAIAGQSRPLTYTSLTGSNLTAWDAYQSSGSFSPVYDGATFEGGYYHYDAFDQGLALYVDGNTIGDPDDEVTVENNGYAVGPDDAGPLKIRRYEWASGPYLRSLIELRNPTNSGVDTTVEIYSDLGSDGSEDIIDSSNGDAEDYALNDRWVISSQDQPPVAYDDPALTFVTYGKGGEQPVTLNNGFGSGYFDYEYEFKVPGDKTRYVLLFTEMHGRLGKAKKDAKKYDDSNLSAGLLKGISQSKLKDIVNWDLG